MTITHHTRSLRSLIAASALAVTLVAAGCTSSVASQRRTPDSPRLAMPGPAMLVTNADDAATARSLAQLIGAHPEFGLRVVRLDGPRVGVQWGVGTFVLRPRITGRGGVNRLVVEQYYYVSPEQYRGHEGEVVAACDRINRRSDFLNTRIVPRVGAPLFVATSDLTFGNHLSLWHLTRYLVELKRATLVVLSPALGRYLV